MKRSALIRFCSIDKRLYVAFARGFTLIEVVVAVALLSLVMSSVYGIFSTISSTQKRLEDESEGYHQARVIFDRVGRELSGSYLAIGNECSALSAGNDSNGDPYLAFTSTSALTRGDDPDTLVRVRYEVDTESDKVVGRLLRSAVPLFFPENLGHSQRLSSQIKQLKWRFYDGSSWQDDWDSIISNSLPQTVEMSMTLLSNDHEIQALTAFDLSLSRVGR
jgi:general secretion pathway protein J